MRSLDEAIEDIRKIRREESIKEMIDYSKRVFEFYSRFNGSSSTTNTSYKFYTNTSIDDFKKEDPEPEESKEFLFDQSELDIPEE